MTLRHEIRNHFNLGEARLVDTIAFEPICPRTALLRTRVRRFFVQRFCSAEGISAWQKRFRAATLLFTKQEVIPARLQLSAVLIWNNPRRALS